MTRLPAVVAQLAPERSPDEFLRELSPERRAALRAAIEREIVVAQRKLAILDSFERDEQLEQLRALAQARRRNDGRRKTKAARSSRKGNRR